MSMMPSAAQIVRPDISMHLSRFTLVCFWHMNLTKSLHYRALDSQERTSSLWAVWPWLDLPQLSLESNWQVERDLWPRLGWPLESPWTQTWPEPVSSCGLESSWWPPSDTAQQMMPDSWERLKEMKGTQSSSFLIHIGLFVILQSIADKSMLSRSFLKRILCPYPGSAMHA